MVTALATKGTLAVGDVQWMTAGSGILHQEMPKGDADGRMHGFQLWANLPKSHKMTAPRYQDIAMADVPEATEDDGTRVRIVCGKFWGQQEPVEGVATDPRYLDVSVPPSIRRQIPVDRTHNVFAYVFAGSGTFRDASVPRAILTEDVSCPDAEPVYEATNRSLFLFDAGDEVTVQAGDKGIRFLLISGRPLEEPAAWRGPIVMNTADELRQAYQELRDGTFIGG